VTQNVPCARLTGRVALVTGSTGGIGVEIVRRLAAEGARVVVTDVDAAPCAELVDELPGEHLGLALDVGDEDAWRAAVERVHSAFGRLDVLVNNAAGFVDWSETAASADLAAAHALLDVNLFGPWRVTQALLPLLREAEHGRIVNVASGAGSHGDDAFGLTTGGGAAASYGISKAAVNALTAKLAAELAGTRVLVNSVCPGLTATAPVARVGRRFSAARAPRPGGRRACRSCRSRPGTADRRRMRGAWCPSGRGCRCGCRR
jgi:NAD(P)-dependent dehydrogenase (short-subunit alcohol dehydrogenase family)